MAFTNWMQQDLVYYYYYIHLIIVYIYIIYIYKFITTPTDMKKPVWMMSERAGPGAAQLKSADTVCTISEFQRNPAVDKVNELTVTNTLLWSLKQKLGSRPTGYESMCTTPAGYETKCITFANYETKCITPAGCKTMCITPAANRTYVLIHWQSKFDWTSTRCFTDNL